MAISIDWGTSIIFVPSGDLASVQETPTIIKELNLNTFRLALKDLEDDAEGMGFLKTHTHNTEVTVGGVTLARVVEILDPYTITFEDGQYAVNLVGANSNVSDKVNVNQVSVRSANSAGLVSAGTDPEVVAQAVWDQAIATVTTANSMGEALLEMYRLQGLDYTSPMQVSTTSRTASGINQTISESVSGVVTVTRI
jgi:hypothetical protein